ncbi:MAG: hypothetical protein ACD_41C00035G0003 [uncultured bacterium]|nr:MAG: hypothetical protein ACD_41C00035G0003 [uncultured bacterium]HBY74222.1 hypothetical protein [Candidatus Kerfeldbacteria bacterium]
MFWIVLFSLLWPQAALADIVLPTSTTIYFEQDNAPVTAPVDFAVSCYGYSWAPGPSPELAPGSYTPVEVYSFAAQCPSYGCSIDEPYYLNYRYIDYCLLTATVDHTTSLVNIGNKPYSECDTHFTVQACTSYFDLSADPTTAARPVHSRSFWLALLLTFIIETAVLILALKVVLRKRLQPAVRWKTVLSLGVGLSAATLPYLWFVLPNIPYISVVFPKWYVWSTLVEEIIVIIVEAMLLRKWVPLSKRAAIFISAIANIASFTIGLVLAYWY